MFGLGSIEIIIIALLLFLFFGGKKLPEFVKGLGEAVREFRKGLKGEK